jgi:hypothetical protein
VFLLFPSGVLVALAAQVTLVQNGKDPVTLGAKVAHDVLRHVAIRGQLLDLVPRCGYNGGVVFQVGPIVALYQLEKVSHTSCRHAASNDLVYHLASERLARLEVCPRDVDVTTVDH